MPVTRESIQSYLKTLYGEGLKVISVGGLEGGVEGSELKEFGYGSPLRVDYTTAGGDAQTVVISSMRTSGGFGHDHMADRAAVLLWQHSCLSRLPRHVPSEDVGYFTSDGRLVSAADADEFFITMPFIKGREYYHDLEEIKNDGLTELGLKRAVTLAEYLAEIHSRRNPDGVLYERRIRDLVGHGECIMGLVDSYPRDFKSSREDFFVELEKRCIDWRHRLRDRYDRLCQVHGDFHPWNVMFGEGTDFSVLDRSRGEWGEAADDLSSMAMNYIFFALLQRGSFTGDFAKLMVTYWDAYIKKSQDNEINGFVQPFFAFRGLVVASPVWYPNIPEEMRAKLLAFTYNVLDIDEFSVNDVGKYLKEN
jgi:hypothetical protein